MPEEIVTAPVTTAATTAPADAKPSEVVADAAKAVAAESKEPDGQTLLGETGEKAEAKPGEKVEPIAPAVVPEKYEVKVPEGMTLDKATLDALTPVFKDLKLGQDSVQKLVDAYAPQVKSMMEAQQQAAIASYKATVDGWKAETLKELGNDASKELSYAAKFIDKYGDPKVRELLNETGVGNNIALAKLFIAAGKAISSDSFPDSGKKGTGEMTAEEAAAKLFPSSKN